MYLVPKSDSEYGLKGIVTLKRSPEHPLCRYRRIFGTWSLVRLSASSVPINHRSLALFSKHFPQELGRFIVPNKISVLAITERIPGEWVVYQPSFNPEFSSTLVPIFDFQIFLQLPSSHLLQYSSTQQLTSLLSGSNAKNRVGMVLWKEHPHCDGLFLSCAR